MTKTSWLIALALLAVTGAAVAAWMMWGPRSTASGILEASGRIEGDQAAVGAKVGGRLVALAVREGQRLPAGAVIAELASEQVQAELQRAEHALHTSREQLGEARSRRVATERQAEGAEMAAVLAEQESRARVGEAEAALGTARARLAAAERQLEQAELAVTLAERESRARIGEAEAAVGAARAGLRQADADREKAARDYARSRELFGRELIAAQELDQAKAAGAMAEAATEAAREQVGRAEEGLELARASRVAIELRRKEAQTAGEGVRAARSLVSQAGQALELARASRVAIEVRRKEAQTAAERVREGAAAVRTLEAQVQAMEAAVRLARANLADARVLAPFGGTILRKLVEPGEVVAAGTPLVTLVDTSRLYAKVYVAEAELGKVKVGDPARLYTDAFPQRAFAAAVSEVSQQAEFTPRDIHMKDERVTQVFAVKLAVQNPEGILKPGMPVDARIRWRPDADWARAD